MIVGSEMGNAEMVGDIARDHLESEGHAVQLSTEPDLDLLMSSNHRAVLVITSTTGLGDVPQNIEPLYDALREESADLSHLRYGIVGMGDRNYRESYCGGPRRMDEALQARGAIRVGERLELDATDNPTPDEDAVAWLPAWLAALEA